METWQIVCSINLYILQWHLSLSGTYSLIRNFQLSINIFMMEVHGNKGCESAYKRCLHCTNGEQVPYGALINHNILNELFLNSCRYVCTMCTIFRPQLLQHSNGFSSYNIIEKWCMDYDLKQDCKWPKTKQNTDSPTTFLTFQWISS